MTLNNVPQSSHNSLLDVNLYKESFYCFMCNLRFYHLLYDLILDHVLYGMWRNLVSLSYVRKEKESLSNANSPLCPSVTWIQHNLTSIPHLSM